MDFSTDSSVLAHGLARQILVPISKLNPPRLNELSILRDRLLERLCAADAAQIVLVRAAPGFGKSTLMVQCRARLLRAGVRSAWVTIDQTDNDVTRLFSCLEAALGLADEQASGASIKSLIERLSRQSRPIILFLDEFEHLKASAVLTFVREFLDRCPRQLRVVIAARGLPDIGIQHLQQRNSLLQLTEMDLRFDEQEAAMLLRKEGFESFNAVAVARFLRKTEGWPMALLVVTTALRRSGDISVIERCSSYREIADYLDEEVFAPQAPEHREFLMRTSILDELVPALCVALCPGTDALAVLERLVQGNLFVMPLDGRVQVFRYHSLLRDHLRQKLQRESPHEVVRLHRIASGWYEKVNRPVRAIEHALEANDWTTASRLLELSGERLLEQGRFQLLARWLARLPEAELSRRPMMLALRIWVVCLTAGPVCAMSLHESGLQASSDCSIASTHLRIQWPFMLAMADRHEEAFEAGCAALLDLPSGRPMVDGILCNVMAGVSLVLGEMGRAGVLLDTARALSTSSSFLHMYSESTQGLLDLQAGRLRHAVARFRLARSHERGQGSFPHGNAWVAVMYACALYEMQAFDEADNLACVHLPTTREMGLPDDLIGACVVRSRVAYERGEHDLALQWLFDLEHLGHQRGLHRVVASAKVERARLLLLQGQAEASRQALQLAEDPVLWERVRRLHLPSHETDDLWIGRIRWEIAFGDVELALTLVGDEIAAAGERRRRWLKLVVLQCLAMHRLGHRQRALSLFEPVLRECCNEGFVRLILDEGPSVEVLLRGQYAQYSATYDRSDPELREYCERLLGWLQPSRPPVEAYGKQTAQGLSEKELRVLGLLAEGQSNREICEALFLSDSTVRTHLRRISRKLGANSRSQSIAIARSQGFIR